MMLIRDALIRHWLIIGQSADTD